MDWIPSSPNTTLPPYLRTGFSACNAVGARSDGVGGANACAAHSCMQDDNAHDTAAY